MLKLALQTRLPFIYVKTDDILNVAEILTHYAGEEVKPTVLPKVIEKLEDIKLGSGNYFYTSDSCASLVKLYNYCETNEKTIVFVNTEKSVLQFDSGTLVTPKEMVLAILEQVSEDPESLLPAFGGMNLKDVQEAANMTMTRDESLTARGIGTTRQGYVDLKGISQVDTEIPYYICPHQLEKWITKNASFFTHPTHPALVPRGLLFDGPPGTGKTLASKYLAAILGVPLYHMDLGSMLGKYVGESEEALNAVLAQIDQVEPCVVLLDEVEKIFVTQSDSGVTSKLLARLLWWLQEHKSKVLTVMTTNDVKKIPKELYRPGRINETMNFLGIESSLEGMAFAQGEFKVLTAAMNMGELATENNLNILNSRVKSLFGGQAVPQTVLSETSKELIKEVLTDTLPEPKVTHIKLGKQPKKGAAQ